MTTSSGGDDCAVPPDRATVELPDDDALAALAKALAHPARIRIVRMLAEQASCVTGIVVDEIGLAQSTVSEHLRVLRAAGLVRGEVDGPRTRYCLDRNGLARLELGVATLGLTSAADAMGGNRNVSNQVATTNAAEPNNAASKPPHTYSAPDSNVPTRRPAALAE
ncbi:MAG: winged helix-turn-helix transcriptional regulator [Actinobacteria bacterium]|nr:winged helix-turn-helix transcriptional regulator [Actinomycetota bacterium]